MWSVDNETDKARDGRSRKKKRERKVRKVGKRSENTGRVMVSGSVLMEVETVLQTQVAFRVSFRCFIFCNFSLLCVYLNFGMYWWIEM